MPPEQRAACQSGGEPAPAPPLRKVLLPTPDAVGGRTSDLFRYLLETSPDAVLVVDEAGTILFANLQAESLFEYPPEALIGQNVDALVPGRLRAAHASHRRDYAAASRIRPMGSGLTLLGQKRGGGEFPVKISLSPVRLGEQQLVSASIRDVSAEVAQQEELQRARSTAEAASAAKTAFLASMSHELRTPMNAILGFAQLLSRDRKSPLSPRQKERVEHVLRGGEHLLRLIDDVLDLARIEAGGVLISLEPVDVAEVIAEVKDTLDALAARAGQCLEIGALDPTARELVADRTRFRQILMNYGTNAIKYGRAGGTATFSVQALEGRARVHVRDDGIGIALAKQAALFQPFQRAGQETGPIEGTGIGLALSKRLAELMHGTVGFESQEGCGSVFWVELPHGAAAQPACAAAAPATSSPSSVLRGGSGPRHRIVYVEDNPSNIAFMVDLLADFERVELVSAPTAELGIELVRARRPDLVIMDINLPGMSGYEARQRLAAWPETRHIPVIALSAAAVIRGSTRLAGAGFYRYLTKPVKVDELTQVLELLLGAGQPGHPEAAPLRQAD